jgi:hypothetical protein
VEGGTEVIGTNQDLRYPLCSKNVVKHLILFLKKIIRPYLIV